VENSTNRPYSLILKGFNKGIRERSKNKIATKVVIERSRNRTHKNKGKKDRIIAISEFKKYGRYKNKNLIFT